MDPDFQIVPAGDAALMVFFDQKVDPGINLRVHHLAYRLDRHRIPGSGEVVPAYASLTLHYDPLLINYADIHDWVRENIASLAEANPPVPRTIKVPTVYGGAYGPDLAFVAEYHRLSIEEVIQLHSEAVYMVYMMGFSPGFAYLGGLAADLATPRLENPRIRVPAGSVGLAGSQTGIYPIDSPGGWRLIGYTPLKLFNYLVDPPAVLMPGDKVRFIPISEQELADAGSR